MLRMRVSKTSGTKRKYHIRASPLLRRLPRADIDQLESSGARKNYFKYHHMQLNRSLSIKQGQLVPARTHLPQLIQIRTFISYQQVFTQPSCAPKTPAGRHRAWCYSGEKGRSSISLHPCSSAACPTPVLLGTKAQHSN